LRKLRATIDRPVPPPSTLPIGIILGSGMGGTDASASAGRNTNPPTLDHLGLISSCTKALNSLGEVQQQLSEKLVQFTNVIKRDVLARPLEEMITTYEERTNVILSEGSRLDCALHEAQKNVLESFRHYDALFREMEAQRQTSSNTTRNINSTIDHTINKKDLWLAEMIYCINVNRLKHARVEYVKGMSVIFTQFKVNKTKPPLLIVMRLNDVHYDRTLKSCVYRSFKVL
jgi:hypothetical protein